MNNIQCALYICTCKTNKPYILYILHMWIVDLVKKCYVNNNKKMIYRFYFSYCDLLLSYLHQRIVYNFLTLSIKSANA